MVAFVNSTPYPTVVTHEYPNDAVGLLVGYTKVTLEEQSDGEFADCDEQLPVYNEPCDEAPIGECHYTSNPEVADVLGIAKGTVMSRLHRARLALKEELLPYG